MCGASVGISVNKLQLPEQTKTAKGIKNERKKERNNKFYSFFKYAFSSGCCSQAENMEYKFKLARILLFFAYPLCPSNLTSVCLPDCLSTADDQWSVMLIIATQ